MYSHLRYCVGSKSDSTMLQFNKLVGVYFFQGPLMREAGLNGGFE